MLSFVYFSELDKDSFDSRIPRQWHSLTTTYKAQIKQVEVLLPRGLADQRKMSDSFFFAETTKHNHRKSLFRQTDLSFPTVAQAYPPLLQYHEIFSRRLSIPIGFGL